MTRTDIKKTLDLTPPQEALEILLENIQIGPKPENMRIEEAEGRVLSENIRSPETFLRSTSHLWMVTPCSEDTRGAKPEREVTLDVIGRVFPENYPTSSEIRRGEAFYIYFVWSGCV